MKVERWGEKETPQIIAWNRHTWKWGAESASNQERSHEESIPVLEDYEKIIRSKKKCTVFQMSRLDKEKILKN